MGRILGTVVPKLNIANKYHSFASSYAFKPAFFGGELVCFQFLYYFHPIEFLYKIFTLNNVGDVLKEIFN